MLQELLTKLFLASGLLSNPAPNITMDSCESHLLSLATVHEIHECTPLPDAHCNGVYVGDNQVLTAQHCLESRNEFFIRFPNLSTKSFHAQVDYCEPLSDVCALSIQGPLPKTLTPATITHKQPTEHIGSSIVLLGVHHPDALQTFSTIHQQAIPILLENSAAITGFLTTSPRPGTLDYPYKIAPIKELQETTIPVMGGLSGSGVYSVSQSGTCTSLVGILSATTTTTYFAIEQSVIHAGDTSYIVPSTALFNVLSRNTSEHPVMAYAIASTNQ